MPVVLLLLILAVLAAVALVAAGRGALMSEAPPDRAPFALPDELTPQALHETKFSVAFRGYRMDQVDEVLDRLVTQLDAKDARIAELEGATSREEADTESSEVLWPAPGED